jgi:hypothetical protein
MTAVGTVGAPSCSPQSLQDTYPSGGFLLWSTMADCQRRNANPESNLAIRPTTERACFNSWSLFGWSGVGYQTLVCMKSLDDCHLSVHLEIMFSLSSFPIALLAVSPEPSTAVELPPAFASLSASSLPRMPTWALTHSYVCACIHEAIGFVKKHLYFSSVTPDLVLHVATR